MKDLFLLDPGITFLNHGSFGACPRPVFARYQELQLEAERNPVEFHARRSPGLLLESRRALGQYLNADPDDVVYVTNATVGVNIIARSLKLGPGDEVLGTDHEYVACERAWRFMGAKSGFHYRQAILPFPVTTHANLIERLFAQVTPATKVIYISHITSPTALTFPVAEICRVARSMGLLTVIDGAHAPGQIDLDVEAVGADFYTGNLHKWLCAPKGAAFLYARREVQRLLEPLVVSWGDQMLSALGPEFIFDHEYIGTRDISAPLAVPAAIEFQSEHRWSEVRLRCHDIISRARPLISEALNAQPLCPDSNEWYAQMCAFLLPEELDGFTLGRRLFEEHKIEIPAAKWGNHQTLRISIQGYNSWEDVERLLEGVQSVVGTL